MAEVALSELREILRSHPRWPDIRLGEDRTLYVRIGPEAGERLTQDTRATSENGDLILYVDRDGKVHGVEFW